MRERINTFNEFIQNLHLKNLRVFELSSKRKEDFLPPAKVDITRESKFENIGKSEIKMYITYSLSAIQKGKKEPGLLVSVTYCLIFNSKIGMTEEFFERFSASSLVIKTWPYFRNLVHETTMQMGLPSLVLDVFVPKEIKSMETPVKYEQV